jgi:hypothetical protein
MGELVDPADSLKSSRNRRFCKINLIVYFTKSASERSPGSSPGMPTKQIHGLPKPCLMM